MELLISEDVINYMKDDIDKLVSDEKGYDKDDLIDEITKSLAPHQGVKHLDKIMDDSDLYGLVCSCDEDSCYIDTPYGSQSPIYHTFEDLKK